MDRLTLSRRLNPDELDRRPKATLPPNPLPIWTTLPLDAKLPMMPAPKGAVKLFTTKVGEKIHKCVDFDLTDPYALIISNEYKELHDPHLKPYLTQPYMLHRLYKEGLITKSGKVLCNLKEFNEFRQYLRKIHLRMLAKERKGKVEASQREGRDKMADGSSNKAHIQKLQAVRKRIAEKQRLERQRFHRILEQNFERQARKEQARRDLLSETEQRRQVEEARRLNLMNKRRRKERMRRIIMHRRWLEQDLLRRQRAEDRKRQKENELQQKLQHDWEQRKRVQQQKIERENLKREKVERKAKAHQQEWERQIDAQRKKQEERFEEIRRRHREKQAHLQAVYDAKLQAKIARYWEQKKRHRTKGKVRPNLKSTWSLSTCLAGLADDLQDKKKKRTLMSTAHPLINHSVSTLGLNDLRGATVFSTVIGVAKKKSAEGLEKKRSDLAIGDLRGVILTSSEDVMVKAEGTDSTESMGYGDMHGIIALPGSVEPTKESHYTSLSTLTKNISHDIVQAAQFIVQSTVEIVSKIIFPAYQQVQVEKTIEMMEEDDGVLRESEMNQSVSDYGEDEDIVGVVENTALDGEMVLKGVRPPKDALYGNIDFDNDVLGVVRNESDAHVFETKSRKRSVRFSSVDEMLGGDSDAIYPVYELDESGEEGDVEDEVLFRRGDVAYSRPDSTDMSLQSVEGSLEDSADEDMEYVGAPLMSKDSLTLAEKRIAAEKKITSVYVKDALLSLIEDLQAGLLAPEQLLKLAECAREILDGKTSKHQPVSAASSLTAFVDDYVCGVIDKVEEEFEEGLIKPADIAASLIRLGLNTDDTKVVNPKEQGVSSTTSLKAQSIVEEVLEKVCQEIAQGRMEDKDIGNLDDAIAEVALENTERSDTSIFADNFTTDTIERVQRKLKGVQSTPSVVSNASSVFAESFVNSKLNKVFGKLARRRSETRVDQSPVSSMVSAASSNASSLFADEFVNSRIQAVMQGIKSNQGALQDTASVRSIRSRASSLADNIIFRAIEELTFDSSLAEEGDATDTREDKIEERHVPQKEKSHHSSVSKASDTSIAHQLVQGVLQKVVGELRAGKGLDRSSVERIANNMMKWHSNMIGSVEPTGSSEVVATATSKHSLPRAGVSTTSFLAETVINDVFERMLKEVQQDNLNNFEMSHLAKSIDKMASELDWGENLDKVEDQHPVEDIDIVPVIGQTPLDIPQEEIKSGLAALSIKNFQPREIKNVESLRTEARNSFRDIFKPNLSDIVGMTNTRSSQNIIRQNIVQASCHNIGFHGKISRAHAPVSKSYNCAANDYQNMSSPRRASKQSSEDLVSKNSPDVGIEVVNIEHNVDSLRRIDMGVPHSQTKNLDSKTESTGSLSKSVNIRIQPMVGSKPLDIDPDIVAAGLSALSIKTSASPCDIAETAPYSALQRNSFRCVLKPDITKIKEISQKQESIEDFRRKIIASSHTLYGDDTREPGVVRSGISEDYMCDSGSQIKVNYMKHPKNVQQLRDQGRRSSLPEPSLLRQLQSRKIKNGKETQSSSLTAIRRPEADNLLGEVTVRLVGERGSGAELNTRDVSKIQHSSTVSSSNVVDDVDISHASKRARSRVKGTKSSPSAKKSPSSGSRSVPSTPPSHQSCPAVSKCQKVHSSALNTSSTSSVHPCRRSKEKLKDSKEEMNDQAKRLEKGKRSSHANVSSTCDKDSSFIASGGKNKRDGSLAYNKTAAKRSVNSPYAAFQTSPKNSAASLGCRNKDSSSSSSSEQSIQDSNSTSITATQSNSEASSTTSKGGVTGRRSENKTTSPPLSSIVSPTSYSQSVVNTGSSSGPSASAQESRKNTLSDKSSFHDSETSP